MNLHELSPAPGSKRASVRVGRGLGSGLGKTSGKGQKGQKSRSGGVKRPGFEGGQKPLYLRLPKRGFYNRFGMNYVEINVGSLNCFEDGTVVEPVMLIEHGMIKNIRDGVRILGNGELTKKLTVQAMGFSKSAEEKNYCCRRKSRGDLSVRSLANIFRITELRQKVVFTLAMFIVFRAGTHIPVPGVNVAMIEQLFQSGNLFGLLDMFSGGALSKFSIFAMSITPYINASIILQLLKVVVPTLEQWSKEGVEGQKKVTQLTRGGTVLLGFIQALGMAYGLRSAINNPGIMSILLIAISLTAGTVFLMWIGEQITSKGIGNGISLIIFAGIVSRLPDGMHVIFQYLQAGTVNILNVILFAVIALAMIVFVVAISQGIRKIPVQYAKRVVGRKMYGGHSSYIPLKVNQAGVIPIIFASSILMFPVTIGQFVDVAWIKTVAGWFAWGSPLQTTLYVLMILFFTYFYTAVSININDVADNLKKYGGFIPGLRPGKPTSDYLDKIMTRITLAGAIFLSLIALMPNVIGWMTGIEGVYFGGTALLIVVGVALDTMKQIESLVLMRHYQGFMK